MRDVLQVVTCDTSRFNALRERVEMLVEDQARTWTGATGNWLVAPLSRRPDDFYLVSKDREGQRRGREVLQAFLGPQTAAIVSVSVTPRHEDIDRVLVAAGLTQLSRIRLQEGATTETLIAGLEDALATVRTRDPRTNTLRPTHVELLRDLRLALQQGNAPVAEQSLSDLERTGTLSLENLRFLRIELLGCLGRWRDLQRFPQIQELLRARRPRVINEILLEMLWRTELSDLASGQATPQEIYDAANLGARYGSVLSAVDVPESAPGRAVATIAALTRGDDGRLQRLLAAADGDERRKLEQLAAQARPSALRAMPARDLRDLLDGGQYSAVLQSYLDSPDPANAGLAVEAVLECEDLVHAPVVLAIVQALVTAGSLGLSRRLSRDLADLKSLVENSCTGWNDWCSRVARDEPWPEAAQVARAEHTRWKSVQCLSVAHAAEAASSLLTAWAGVNQGQIVAALDVLVVASAEVTDHNGEFQDSVLLILSEQENLSFAVREAYLTLLERLLQNGPTGNRYHDSLRQAADVWQRIASPSATDWAVRLINLLLDAPSPEPDARRGSITSVITRIHGFAQRLSARQRVEMDALREEIDLDLPRFWSSGSDADPIWSSLDGALVGLYSLLPRAEEMLRRRLQQLCPSVAIEGNSDTKATKSLRTLARRADYLIVDTWHASHAATGAIDDERSRDRQIMPKGHGVSAFLQALEDSLNYLG